MFLPSTLFKSKLEKSKKFLYFFYILEKWNFLAVTLRNLLSYVFSKESFSYTSGNGNPEKTSYISGNRTFKPQDWKLSYILG